MPTLGTIYVARPVAEVRYGSTTRQYGFVKLLRSPPAGTMAVLDVLSGTNARTAQASVSRRPVLVPPCTVSPFRMRALTPTSTPCQLLIISGPTADASSMQVEDLADLVRVQIEEAADNLSSAARQPRIERGGDAERRVVGRGS